MPTGMIILLAISVLVFLGLAQRVLDRLQLTDRAALLFVGAMITGVFTCPTAYIQPICKYRGGNHSANFGVSPVCQGRDAG